MSVAQSHPETGQENNLVFLQHTGSVLEEGELNGKVSEDREDEMEDQEIKIGGLSERALRVLVEGNNLNWAVADRYLRLLSSSLGPDSRFRIMTSSFFKALNARDNKKMKKFLSEDGVRMTHVIIVPILTSNRWYFAKI